MDLSQIINEEVSILFLNDINGPTIIPVTRKASLIDTQEQHESLIALKLFNGECKYNKDRDLTIIERYLGKITPDLFVGEDAHILSALKQYGFVSNNFVSMRLSDILTNRRDINEFSNEENKKIKLYINKVLKQSIATNNENDYECLAKLPEIIKKLVEIRGNLLGYGGSVLKSILDK